MSLLFEPLSIGNLALRNRLMRSATAERFGEARTGAPRRPLAHMYRILAEGGVGLIVTGHAFIHPSGKCHPEMTSIADDTLPPVWNGIIRPAQEAGARVMLQINHSGASCDPLVTPHPLSPSGVATNNLIQPEVMAEADIEAIVRWFGQAARRAREAGFDGVQIHGAHGYLISQFLTPRTNQRTDRWGGDAERRQAFLRAVLTEVRVAVGRDYPVWIKLGVAGADPDGLGLEEGASAAATCAALGVDCIEISNALGAPAWVRPGQEAPLLPMAQAVRQAVGPDYPLALVNGFRSLALMEQTLASGVVQVISLCRPLIVEPDLPSKLREGRTQVAACARCDRCWPDSPEEGVACHNKGAQERATVVAEGN